jgi:stage V sporulation protein B
MTVLGVSVVFNALVLVSTAIMQAHGNVHQPVVNMLIGGIIKLILVYFLTGNPEIGIVGTPIGTLTSYVVICLLNFYSIRRTVSDPPRVLVNLIRPLLAALSMGVVVWIAWHLLTVAGISSRVLLAGIPVAVGCAVYLLAAILLKVITREDCLLLPKGEKIAKILKL